MRCERATGLARFVMNLSGNALDTAATQWFERTLDDSSNRRLTLPEGFLALDGALDILANVLGGLVVHRATIKAHLDAELPFMASEDILLAATARGADRQEGKFGDRLVPCGLAQADAMHGHEPADAEHQGLGQQVADASDPSRGDVAEVRHPHVQPEAVARRRPEEGQHDRQQNRRGFRPGCRVIQHVTGEHAVRHDGGDQYHRHARHDDAAEVQKIHRAPIRRCHDGYFTA